MHAYIDTEEVQAGTGGYADRWILREVQVHSVTDRHIDTQEMETPRAPTGEGAQQDTQDTVCDKTCFNTSAPLKP
jgi:hypothetical protein